MAAKTDTLKLLQEIRAYAEISNRRPPPRAIDAMLFQIRPSVLRMALPTYKRWIRVEVQECREAEVKITRIIHNSDSTGAAAAGSRAASDAGALPQSRTGNGLKLSTRS